MTARPVDAAVDTAAVERGTVDWWRGYVRSQFIAYADGADGASIVAESPSFPWRSNSPPPQTESAVAAHRLLLERLVELGWQAEASGSAWYALELHRDAVQASPDR